MIGTQSSKSRENGTIVEVAGPNRFHRPGQTGIPVISFSILRQSSRSAGVDRSHGIRLPGGDFCYAGASPSL